MKSILITGAAGFIGYHLSMRLLEEQFRVVGIDNLNDYYSPDLKQARLDNIFSAPNSQNFSFYKMDISSRSSIENLFKNNTFDIVIHLAAQAGVRYSLENPYAYLDSNLAGFLNVLEAVRHSAVGHFLFASSSSVYGMNQSQPFKTNDRVDFPISLYAATKKSNELMAFTYSHLFKTPITGLRFFTVYGPWGRPDMAYFKFTKAILNNETIDIYNKGAMKRDFTYIDDIINGIRLIMDTIPTDQAMPDTNAFAPFKIYNIGNNQPISLNRFISAIETSCDKKAEKRFLEMQKGDVEITYADIDDLSEKTGFSPRVGIEEGIDNFVKWYKQYYKN